MILILACYGAALAATLVLAAWTTPRTWWRRPNARALALLALGTGALGGALHALLAPPLPLPGTQAAAALPLPGERYRVADTLNLRAAGGVDARRIAVLPAGSIVIATGRRAGDWWQVDAKVAGGTVAGWASSLWLRRAGEARAPLRTPTGASG